MLLSNSPASATWVRVTSPSAPNPRIAASEINLRSSPTLRSAATPAPPAIVRAPDVALVEAVVAVTATTPPLEIVTALRSLAEPNEPPS